MKKDDHKVLTAFIKAENMVRYYGLRYFLADIITKTIRYYRENGLRKTASKIYSTLREREVSQCIEVSSSHDKQEYAPLSDQIFVSLCNDKLIGENKFKDQLETRYALQMILGIIGTIPEPRRTECLRDVVSWLQKVESVVRWDVNPDRNVSEDRIAIQDRLKSTYYFKNIRHVELGTYKAFDNNRVAALKKERGIGEFIRLDISPEYNPDVVADCTKLPFDNGSIDSISSNSLFEHVAYPHKIIEESFRVLSPGGVMQVTMPFFFVQHYCPKDYVRLSPQFFEDICKDIGFKEVYCHVNDFGGLYYTLHEASKAATINETLPPELYKLGKILHHNAIALLAMCTVFDKFFYGNANQFFVSVYCVAFKKGTVGLREQLSADQPMLHRMLPYLVCPVTLSPLFLDSSGNLTTHDGTHTYQVHNGIPFLLSTR